MNMKSLGREFVKLPHYKEVLIDRYKDYDIIITKGP